METANYTVGQLAKATDTKAVTIRYYEGLGLLPSVARSASGYRLYLDEQRHRLLFIRRCRALGFSLDDISELLDLADHRAQSCSTVVIQVHAPTAKVRGR